MNRDESLTGTGVSVNNSMNDSVDEIFNSFTTDDSDETTVPINSEEITRRSGYNLRSKDKINRFICVAECEEPKTFADAISSRNSKDWKLAINDEFDSLVLNKTWYLVNPPPNRKILTNKWIFKIKRNENNEIDRFKARLVVRGFTQIENIDYNEIFSPVVRFDTIRIILTVSSILDLQLCQFDVKTAFLYGKIDTDIYMYQPEGFDDGSGRVCKLNKSLYGLKQASRCWNSRFVEFVKSIGFQTSDSDPSLFLYRKREKLIVLALYVDDGLIAYNCKFELDEILQHLRAEFEVKVNNLSCYIGMRIRKIGKNLYVDQANYAEQMLTRFNMWECKIVKTPIETGGDTNVSKIGTSLNYREAVGSLMYLSLVTRPDISFAVSYASRFLEDTKDCHICLVKRIFRYLRGTYDLGLVFKSESKIEINCFSDSDFANDINTRKSVSGVVLQIGTSSVTWFSRKQNVVVLSTTEAEFVAACEAVK